MKDSDVLLVENIRQHDGEKADDPEFAQNLAKFGDVYVNDAFDNIHRDHASMTELPKLLPAYAGITLFDEIKHLESAMRPKSPSLFIIGGAKFETKMPLVAKFLALYDHVFVGGALLNDVLKWKGDEVGKSLVSDISLAGTPLLNHPKLLSVTDVVVIRGGETVVVYPSNVAADDVIIDIGPETISSLEPYIRNAATVLWNGPLGKYENGAGGSTTDIARLVADSAAYSVIGGGDTVAAVEELGINDAFGFVSIGGGAMLTFLEEGNTPSLEALGYEG